MSVTRSSAAVLGCRRGSSQDRNGDLLKPIQHTLAQAHAPESDAGLHEAHARPGKIDAPWTLRRPPNWLTGSGGWIEVADWNTETMETGVWRRSCGRGGWGREKMQGVAKRGRRERETGKEKREGEKEKATGLRVDASGSEAETWLNGNERTVSPLDGFAAGTGEATFSAGSTHTV